MQKTGNFISVGEILWEVLKKPIVKDITIEEAAEYAINLIKTLGNIVAFEHPDKPLILNVEEYKAKLPSDITYIKGIRLKPNGCEDNGISIREATDTFHLANCKVTTEFTYLINGNYIHTSFPEGVLEISYVKMATDKDGYPLIIDNQRLKNAIVSYILYEYVSGLYDLGKIPDRVYEKYYQKYLFDLASANSELSIPSQDKMESLTNALTRLVVAKYPHVSGYRNFGENEYLKRY